MPGRERETGVARPRPRRSLGQNFLRARWVTRLFAEWACDRRLLLEIGVGEGAVSREILSRCPDSMIYGLELDRRLVPLAAGLSLVSPWFSMIHGDALHPPLRLTAFDGIYGSIPYNITGPLLSLLALEARQPAMLLLQREVAERLAATPGTRTYGRITVLVQAVYRVRLGRVVPPSAFEPRPRVYSRLVYLEPRPDAPPESLVRRLEQLTRCMFSERNKLADKVASRCLGVPRVSLSSFAGRRVYELPVEDFIRLASREGIWPGAARL